MANFWTLVGFEFRKALQKKSSLIATSIFFLIALYTVISPISYTYFKEDIAFARELSGRPLNEALITEAVSAYQQIPINSTMNGYETPEYQQLARAYSPIVATISPVYFSERSGSIHEIQQLDATDFYNLRIDWVAEQTNRTQEPPIVKDFLVEQNTHIETPLTFSYAGGYMHFLGHLMMVGVLSFFLAAFLNSGVFSGEYGRTDDLLLSSKNGRKSLIYAKIFTSFAISIGVFLLICCIVYLGCMFIYGFDGSSEAIQLLFMESPYPLTIGQTAIYAILSLLSLNMMNTVVNLLLSAKMKSTMIVIGLMGLFGFGTQLLNLSKDTGLLYKLSLFLPGNSVTYWELIDTIGFQLGPVVLPPYFFVPLAALALSIILLPFAYHGFKHHQIT